MLEDTENKMRDRGKKVFVCGLQLASAHLLPFAQPHRPRGTEGGRQHKKRVRQPHNTRERQKQVAMGQGEYLMPEVNPYRSSKVRSTKSSYII
jgi:WAS protein family, member 3